MFVILMCAILVTFRESNVATGFANLGSAFYENASACIFLPEQLPHITGLPPFHRLGPTEAIIKPASDSRNYMDRRWIVIHSPASGGLGADTITHSNTDNFKRENSLEGVEQIWQLRAKWHPRKKAIIQIILRGSIKVY